MALGHSKLTSQGQISVPASVRRKLGIGPGSVLEWDEVDAHVVVRRAGKYTSQDIQRAIFPERPRKRTLAEVKEGIRKSMRSRYARR